MYSYKTGPATQKTGSAAMLECSGGNPRQMNLWCLITLPPLLKEQGFPYIQSVNCQCLILIRLFTFLAGCTSVA